MANRSHLLLRGALSKALFLWHRTRIVSYPNSGRTWLRVMLSDLGARPRFTHAQSKFSLALPAGEMGSGMARYTPRRILFLTRDPKDTVASNYFQVTARGKRWQGDFKTFIRHPNYGFERILAFHLSWIEEADRFRRGFRVERYETIRADTEAVLARIVSFLAIPLVERQEITAVAAKNQFEVMQQREASGELYLRHGDRFSPGELDNPQGRKVRRGRIGGHQEDMDGEDLAYCDELMARYGYEEAVTRACG